ncbi:class 1 fructose-bisphosphatase [Patescibacteria group bacterium]
MPERRDPTQLITVQRHFIEEERNAYHASGQLTKLLSDLILAMKTIGHEIRQAGLTDIIGATESQNVHGETQQRLDIYADQVMREVLGRSGTLAAMGSEEVEKVIQIPRPYTRGKYLVLFDPLDGSSNIDVNASVGTTFSIYKRKSSRSGPVSQKEMLLKGREQIAAGYALFGSSTMFVYSSGHGTHGFTFSPDVGEFLLSHPDIKIPNSGKYYSLNEANTNLCDDGTRSYLESIKNLPKARRPSLRYIGTMVADVHRTILKGGIFLYPRSYDGQAFKPKLRLLYEVSPMAMLVEQAGGLATTGQEKILDIKPTELHQRVPLVLGSKSDVKQYLKHQEAFSKKT